MTFIPIIYLMNLCSCDWNWDVDNGWSSANLIKLDLATLYSWLPKRDCSINLQKTNRMKERKKRKKKTERWQNPNLFLAMIFILGPNFRILMYLDWVIFQIFNIDTGLSWVIGSLEKKKKKFWFIM